MHQQIISKNKRIFLSRLPIELIRKILSYLPLEDIFLLETVEDLKSFYQLEREDGIILFLKESFNLQQEINSLLIIQKILMTWRDRKITRLPFWGCKTNGGVLYNSLPYWINKLFFKTIQSVIGFQKNKNISTIGYLSQDYYELQNIITNLSKTMKKVFNTQDFKENIQQISLKYIIVNTFQIDPENFQEPNHRLELIFYRKKLFEIAIKLKEFLQQSEGPIYNNTEAIRLQMISNIHQVELSRQFDEQDELRLINPCQTLLISIKQSMESIPNFISLQHISIDKTNLSKEELEEFNWNNKYQVNQQKKFRYIVFQKNPYGIILWIDMGNEKKIELKIGYKARVWTDIINIHMIKGRNETLAEGISFGYISFKGIII